MLEDGNLFKAVRDGHFNDELHFAEMISLMGPPPKQFLERSDRCRQYWDREGKFSQTGTKIGRLHSIGAASLTIEGNWIAATPIPDQTLQSREIRLEGEDRELLLALMRKFLRWLPEERPSAQDLFEDKFLTQFMLEYQPSTP